MVPHQKIKSQYNIKSLNMQRSHHPFFHPFFFCLYIYPLRMAVEKRTSYFWWLGVDDDKGQVRSSGEGRGKGELILQLHEIYLILCVRFSLNTEKEKVVDLNSHGIHESLCCLSVCLSVFRPWIWTCRVIIMVDACIHIVKLFFIKNVGTSFYLNPSF